MRGYILVVVAVFVSGRSFVLFAFVLAGFFLFGCDIPVWCNSAVAEIVFDYVPEEYRNVSWNVTGAAVYRGEMHCRVAITPTQDVPVTDMYIDRNLTHVWVVAPDFQYCYGDGCPLEFFRCTSDDECGSSCSGGSRAVSRCVNSVCTPSERPVVCAGGCLNSTHCRNIRDLVITDPIRGGIDSDGDGVADVFDDCPDTPEPSLVFSNGCRCSDSDGENEFTQGSAELQSAVPPGEYNMTYSPGNNLAYQYADTCADDDTVEEQICNEDDEIDSTPIDCSGVCIDGRCASVTPVQFFDADNQTKPLAGINVTISLDDGGANLYRSSQFTSANGLLDLDEQALFGQFESNAGSTLCATVRFVDEFNRFEVRNAPAANVLNNLTIANPGAVYTWNACITSGVDGAFLNLTIAAGNGRSFAKIFYHTREAANYQENVLGVPVNYVAPEEIYINSVACTGGCHYGSIWVGTTWDGGIHFSAANMPWNTPDAPVNREWHEFGHHMMLNKFSYIPPRQGSNHLGYNNPSSNDSWVEGWAEFTAIAIKNHYNYPGANLYFVGATPFNMETNYKVNGTFTFPSGFTWSVEEMAVASILYDLMDGTTGDGVDYSQTQIWGVIAANYTFPGEAGTRPIQNLYDLYWALNGSSLPGIKGDADGDGKNNLNEIFISHNAYADSNGDGNYDNGEPIGYTLKNGVARYGKPEVPGSYILVNAVDSASGKKIDWFWLEGTVKVDGCYEELGEYCDYEFTSLVTEPKIHIMMPTPEYSSVMTLRVHPEGYAASEPIVIKSDYYWSVLNDKNEYFAKYDLRLTPEKQKPIKPPTPTTPGTGNGSGTVQPGTGGGISVPGVPGIGGGTVAR